MNDELAEQKAMSLIRLTIFAGTLVAWLMDPLAALAQNEAGGTVQPTVEEATETDENPSAGLDVETIREFRLLDRNGDRSLSRVEFGFSEIVQRSLQANPRAATDTIFARIDKDGDDRIGLFELVQSQLNRNLRIMDPKVAKEYHGFDGNGDGFVGEQEYANAIAAGENLDEDGRAGRATDFRRIDLNRSGIVGPFEFTQSRPDPSVHLATSEVAEKFSRFDADDNGAIKRTEYMARGFSRYPHSPDRDTVGIKFDKLDLNGNDEVGPHEYAKFQAALDRKDISADTLKKFTELDRNKDGIISRREYSRSDYASMEGNRDLVDKVYALIDTNGDGEVGLREFDNRFTALGRGSRNFGKFGDGKGGKSGN